MRASPLSKASRSKPLAGAITATRSPGRSAGGSWKVAVNGDPVQLATPYNNAQRTSGHARKVDDRFYSVAAAVGRLLAAGAARAAALPGRVAAAAALQARRAHGRGRVR